MRGFIKLSVFIILFLGIICSMPCISKSYAFELKSPDFDQNGEIPLRYTSLGSNMSPPLVWSGVPLGTKSLVLIIDDPDAPSGTWTHWVIYDIPAGTKKLRANIPVRGVLPNGTKQGINSFHTLGYRGPHPPPGPAHRYVFTLYAIDVFLGTPSGVDKNTVLDKMRGHVLGETETIGIFGR